MNSSRWNSLGFAMAWLAAASFWHYADNVWLSMPSPSEPAHIARFHFLFGFFVMAASTLWAVPVHYLTRLRIQRTRQAEPSVWEALARGAVAAVASIALIAVVAFGTGRLTAAGFDVSGLLYLLVITPAIAAGTWLSEKAVLRRR